MRTLLSGFLIDYDRLFQNLADERALAAMFEFIRRSLPIIPTTPNSGKRLDGPATPSRLMGTAASV
jgi:hypothetical protein